MAHPDHYAILLAINYYPGLRDLSGPEHDINAFEQWLLLPGGGDMPGENINVIRSSAFAKVADPNDANPTEIAFKKALDALVRDDQRNWKGRVGQRLYLYMAGHGFTAGSSISDPALFSAVAQNGDTAHIAGYRYASRIANAGFFDEIVLIMDCCQDVLKASQVLDPTWAPPDRNKSAVVKLLQAYGAPRGQAAFERLDQATGKTRGLFSKVLIQALDAALPDAQGFVTGQTLKNQFFQLWGDQYKQETGYDPPIRPPDGADMQLFARAPNEAALRKSVTFTFALPVPDDAVLQIVEGASNQLALSVPAAGVAPQLLSPGLYKAMLAGTGRSQLFEVTGMETQTVPL